LGELAVAELLEVADFDDQIIAEGAELIPSMPCGTGQIFAQEGLFFEQSLMKAAHGSPVIDQLDHGHAEGDGQKKRDNDEHGEAFGS